MTQSTTEVYQLTHKGEQIDSILTTASTKILQQQEQISVLKSQMSTKTTRQVKEIELPVSNEWSTENKVYVYRVAFPDMNASITPHIVPINITPTNYDALMEAWNCITRAESYYQGDIGGGIAFYCYDMAPKAALTLQVEYFV